MTDMDDATVTVQTTDVGTEAGNLSSGLNQGGYLITLKKELPITSKTAKADTVYVVSDLAEAVTSMADSRWTGNTVTAAPKFSVDGSGKATLVASPTALAALSMLNAGENGEGYGDFYVEYTLTMSKLPTEKNNYFDQFLCMDSYGTTDKNAWDAALFFDTRASQAPKKTFWARLRTMPNTEESFTKNYSDTFADPDIGEGLPMKVGMLVYDSTVTLLINGEEAVSYTGTTEYRGWFGIWLGNTTATAMIENFIYVPINGKSIVDLEVAAIEDVPLYGTITIPSVTPIYNWPYDKGGETTDGVTVEGFDNTKVGKQMVTVSYDGFSRQAVVNVVDNSVETIVSEDFDANSFADSTKWMTVSNVNFNDGKVVLENSKNATAYTAEYFTDGYIETTLKLSEANIASGKTIYPATLVARQAAAGGGEVRARVKITDNTDGTYSAWIQTLVMSSDNSSVGNVQAYYGADAKIEGFALNKEYTVRLSCIGNYVETVVNGNAVAQYIIPDKIGVNETQGNFGFENAYHAANGGICVTLDDLVIVKYTPYTIDLAQTKVSLTSYNIMKQTGSFEQGIRTAFATGEHITLTVIPDDGCQLSATGGLTYQIENVDTRYSISQRKYGEGRNPDVCNQFVLTMPSGNIKLNDRYYVTGNAEGTANIGIKGVGIREESEAQKAALRFSSRAYKVYKDSEGTEYKLKEVGSLMFKSSLIENIDASSLIACYESEGGVYKDGADNVIGKKVTATKAQDICNDFIDWGLYLTYKADSGLFAEKYTVYPYAVYEADGKDPIVKFSETPITYSYNEVAGKVGYAIR